MAFTVADLRAETVTTVVDKDAEVAVATDENGNVAVADSDGNVVVQDRHGNTHVEDEDGNTVSMDKHGNVTAADVVTEDGDHVTVE